MRKEDIETGFIVKAVFRKYGKHIIVGEAIEICTNEHGLDGDWAALELLEEILRINMLGGC